jgi:transposase
MTIVAERYAHVVGVDTHARTHTYALLSSATGQVADTATFPTSPPGIGRAIKWIGNRTTGTAVLVSIEGASSYGAGLTRALQSAGIDACDVRPPRRASRTGTGKSDAIDAVAAARTILGSDLQCLLQPRRDGDRNALRILVNARRSMDTQRSADRHALTALARTVDLGIDVRKPLTDAQIRAISRWRPHPLDDRSARVARAEARRLATAIIRFTNGMAENQAGLAEIVAVMAPGLLDVYGVGPVTGAIILTAYSHHGRIRSEAAFAALAGVNPIPASSGNTIRHRLNQHGDRQLNRALDIIAKTRMRSDRVTKDYVQRRTQEGKTMREIRRCLKRAIARQLYRKINAIMP